MIEWKTGEIPREPLTIIAADDLVTFPIYAKNKNLLETKGWKRFKGIAKRQKKIFRLENQAKLRSFQSALKYKYGFQVLRDCIHTKILDKKNENTKWQDSTFLKMKKILITTHLMI